MQLGASSNIGARQTIAAQDRNGFNKNATDAGFIDPQIDAGTGLVPSNLSRCHSHRGGNEESPSQRTENKKESKGEESYVGYQN